jgi:hypothetical protein
MRRLSALLAIATAAAAPTAARAAMDVAVSITPHAPRVGQRVKITLRTYAPFLRSDGSCCDLRPWNVGHYPFRFVAVTPRGRSIPITLKKSPNPVVWAGHFVFLRPGHWRLVVTNFPACEHSPGARPCLSVRVRPRQTTR